MEINYSKLCDCYLLRWICGHTRRDRVRNDDIRDRLGVAPIEEKLVQHRLRWFEHVQRCYGWRWGCWDREERVEGSGGDVRATVPAALQYPRVLFTWWWRWLGLGALGEAGRGASPTAGKREGISF